MSVYNTVQYFLIIMVSVLDHSSSIHHGDSSNTYINNQQYINSIILYHSPMTSSLLATAVTTPTTMIFSQFIAAIASWETIFGV